MTKGYRITYSVGIGLDLEGLPVLNLDKKIKLAKTEAAVTFGGFDLSYRSGGWIDGEGKYIEEPAAIFTAIIGEDKLYAIEDFAVFLRLEFNQTSVLMTRQPIDFEFVESGKAVSIRD